MPVGVSMQIHIQLRSVVQTNKEMQHQTNMAMSE